jgi:hypothetical protein
MSLIYRGILVREISYKEIIDMIEMYTVIFRYALHQIEQEDIPINYATLREYLDVSTQVEHNNQYLVYTVECLSMGDPKKWIHVCPIYAMIVRIIWMGEHNRNEHFHCRTACQKLRNERFV